MGKRSRIEIHGNLSAPPIGINRCKACRQRPDSTGASQGQSTVAIKQRLNGSPQLGPKLDLGREGPFGDCRSQSRVEYDFVRECDCLAHDVNDSTLLPEGQLLRQ